MKTNIGRNAALVLLTALTAFAGCAQDVEEINRVQNNYTKKSELRGEFYFKSTVTEAPYASFGYFAGAQNYLTERGVFEIQEKTLFFFRTYEFLEGGETLGASPDIDTPLYETNADGSMKLDAAGKKIPVTYKRRIGDKVYTVHKYVYRGAPILAFKIASHFDIKSAYNPLTGEQTNVVEENTADRIWSDREYMRVHWGAAQLFHWDETISPQVAGIQNSAMLPAEILDETDHPDQVPVKVYNDGGTLDYFDYKVNVNIEAPESYYGESGFEYIPTCWYYPWFAGQVFECVSERIAFRHSFMRVKPSDYVAWDYDDEAQGKFGYYRLERGVYDAVQDYTFSGATRRIRRHRMWENYVVKKGATCKAPTGNAYAGTCGDGSTCIADWAPTSDKAKGCSDGSTCQTECQTGEVCSPLPGEKDMYCVAADANDRLDYAKMTPKPLVWYLSEEYPRELVPETIELAEDWSVPFVDVVKARKGTDPGHPMFVLCENNLEEAGKAMQTYGLDITNEQDVAKAQKDGILAGIDGFCEDMGSPKRNGDQRYSQIHSVNPPTSVGLYGYGPSGADPLSGEMISANAYMYSPAMKRGANTAMYTIELLTGIRSFWEGIYGNNIIERGQKTRLAAATGGLPNWTEQTAKEAAANMLAPNVRERLQTEGLTRTDQDFAADRMAILPKYEPAIAKMFVTEDVKMLHRDPTFALESSEPTAEQLERLGMHVWGHQGGNMAKKLEQWRSYGEGACKYREEFADNAIIGVAREYAAEMNQKVCDAAMAAENTVFDFAEFDEVGDKCDAAGAQSDDGLMLCDMVKTSKDGPAELRWTNPCTVGKLKTQLVESLVKLEQLNPYNLSHNYYPPDPVYSDTKHEVIQSSQMVLLENIEGLREDMILRLYKRIYFGVAEHEVGHSLGLRHNFEASTDAMNFGKQYWELKGQFDGSGHFNAHDMFSSETRQQALQGMRPLQVSSVMDYTSKFNDRWDGLGHYDRAAIKFGYGGIVEVFAKDPDVARFEKYMADPEDTDPTAYPIVPDRPRPLEKMFYRVHYTKIPELFGDIESIYDRTDVPMSQVKDSRTADGKWEVPYRFCGDELSYRLPTCATWDAGVDAFEIVRNSIEDYEFYWPLWAFWRNSNTFFPDHYYDRVARVFGAMKTQMQWWVTDYVRFNQNDWWKKRFGVAWHEDPLGGLPGSVAVIDGANTMAATFGRPEPGLHGYRAKRNVWEMVPWLDNSLYSDTKYITNVNCDARELYPAWDYQYYTPIPTRGGQIYERLLAFEMLADPTTDFLAADTMSGTYADVEKYLISYHTLFPTELMNMFGGMLANRVERYGWYMMLDEKGKPNRCHRRALVGPGAAAPSEKNWVFNPEPTDYTFPTTRFRVPMLAAYYGLSLFLDSYDKSFVDTTRVYMEEHMAAITPGPDADVKTFSDPLSGKSYTAIRSKFAGEVFHPAFDMMEQMEQLITELKAEHGAGWLQWLQEHYNYSQYQFVLDKLELLRSMNYRYDYKELD